MAAPKMPKNTCPAIDDIIEYAKEMRQLADSIISEIEHLRDANSQLRECAKYWEEQANYWEEQASE